MGATFIVRGEFPQDAPVAYTWEGQLLPVNLDTIEYASEPPRLNGPIVILDADHE